MMCSIEVPVIRGGWLIQCIDSVLQQSSDNWRLSLLWDQGDALSDRILRDLEGLGHPRIAVHRAPERLGIARARQYLTERSRGELVLPLDDDDVLMPHAVARFLEAAAARPWAGITRARRVFIDDCGQPVLMQDWFKFEPRQYINGATKDVSNHSQPYAIRRSALNAVGGWRGFDDYQHAGEDCSCFMKIEELAEVELLDEQLYAYRLHGARTSLQYGRADADEMWRRITDESLSRRQLKLERSNDSPPFAYALEHRQRASVADIDFVIPFIEGNECEIEYAASRPTGKGELFPLRPDTHFVQSFEPAPEGASRIEVSLATGGPVFGQLELAFFQDDRSFSPAFELTQRLEVHTKTDFEVARVPLPTADHPAFRRVEISFTPDAVASSSELSLHVVHAAGERNSMLRLFRPQAGWGRSRLDRCLASIRAAGADNDAIFVIEKAQGSSANRNEAFRSTRRPWVCFMDDDAELAAPSTLPVMLERMQRWGAGLCGPKLLAANGRIYSGIPYTDPLTLDACVAGLGSVDTGEYDVTTLVPWLPSTVLLVHRSVLHATGGFDESYLGSQHEDVDFALRARSRGFSCLYVGNVSAVHHNSLRNGQFRKNMDYLKARWRNRPDLFAWSAADGRARPSL